ncbi:galactokinase [Streptomyces clavuligerus]|nr:galactokinase [Streptomyces clavuligerus]
MPCRACLSGEDLDWLGGGRSVSLALELRTTVETLPGPAPGPEPRQPRQDGREGPDARGGGWADEVWTALRERAPGLGPRPPAVRVRSDAPPASGLSSSTALIVALFRAYADTVLDPPGIGPATLAQWAYAFEFERFHGGGMDHLAVIEAGALLLEGRTSGLPAIRERRAFPEEWDVLVVDSGIRKDTGDHIKVVRAQLAAGDPDLAAYREEADAASAEVWTALGARDLDGLARAMDRAHTAMRDHQRMSTPALEEIRSLTLRASGLRLKLSGAGGGGSLVAVCPAADSEELAAAVRGALRAPYPAARVIPTRAAPAPR